jgi:hypothetical protein
VYGLVVKALADLARDHLDEADWRAVCARTGVDDTFVGTRAYPDEMVMQLVGGVAAELGTTTDDVLRQLGRRWISFTADEGWGPLLEALGPDLTTALLGLDDLHVRVGLVLPHLRPPSFDVSDVDGEGMLLHYRSHRAGLAPMVVGLVEQLGARLGTPVTVVHVGRTEDADAFAVRFVDDVVR